jgi:hypothetical protein
MKEKNSWNKYSLFSVDLTPEELTMAKQATIEIDAVITDAAQKIYELTRKYQEVGASDTMSMDWIIEEFSRKARWGNKRDA